MCMGKAGLEGEGDGQRRALTSPVQWARQTDNSAWLQCERGNHLRACFSYSEIRTVSNLVSFRGAADDDMGKSRVLVLIEKVDIIREYYRTKQTSHLAAAFNCHRGQIHHILKHKDEYLADWLATKDPQRTRRPRCKVLNALGIILYEWIERCQRYDFTITDEMVKQTAVMIAKHLKYTLFKPNPKWFARFKQKYKLDKVDWSTWNRDVGINAKSLDLELITNDVRAVHGESVIPMYVQINDDVFENLTVRCYGNENVAEALGEVIHSGGGDRPIEIDLSDGEEIDDTGETSTSFPSHSHDSETNGAGSEQDYDEFPAHKIDDTINVVNEAEAKVIESYRQALNALGPLEQFALAMEDIRAVGLINQLEIIFREQMTKENNS